MTLKSTGIFRLSTLALLSVILLNSCTTYEKDPNEIVVHQLSDPDMLNPINNSGASSTAIMSNIFQRLMYIDHKTLELTPVLAAAKPTVEMVSDSVNGDRMHITYTLKPDAVWDDGSAVTANDVEFTIKAALNPKVDNMQKKSYLLNIKDFIKYDDDPLKFTFVTDVYIRAEYTTAAELPIVPEYVYDANGLMKEFTIKQLAEEAETLAENPKIIEFAKDINSEKWQRQKGFISGSGAYAFEEWKTGQYIVLKKKENWWGHKYEGTTSYFDAHMNKITYQIINDQTAAITALKAENLDAMYGIKSKDFHELPESPAFTENFNGEAAPYLAYSYLGINTKIPQLENKLTRQALAHLVDVDRVIEKVGYGYGERIVGTVHTTNKKFYNYDIEMYQLNLEKAKELLAQAGWGDSDGDGILDMETEDGELIDFRITFSYNSGNDERKAVALMFKEEARKVGIEVEIEPQEWTIYIENTKDHNFDMYYGAWIMEHAPDDPNQLFHTESANGGSNYPSFGNEYSDSLIDAIGITIDEAKRKELWYELQEVMHNEVPYIFLSAPKNKIAIHKRFENAYTSAMYPGFWEAGFKAKATAE